MTIEGSRSFGTPYMRWKHQIIMNVERGATVWDEALEYFPVSETYYLIHI